jgi:hypothetical protein
LCRYSSEGTPLHPVAAALATARDAFGAVEDDNKGDFAVPLALRADLFAAKVGGLYKLLRCCTSCIQWRSVHVGSNPRGCTYQKSARFPNIEPIK